MSRYANKRLHMRTAGGQFRQATGEDIGIMGVCLVCRHFLLRHYDGDPRDPNPDPRRFRNRCFTCEPETDTEKALAADIEASKPATPSILNILKPAQPSPDEPPAPLAALWQDEEDEG